MRVVRSLVMMGGVMVALSGCKVFVKEEPPPCPRVSILGHAEKMTRFRPGTGRDGSDVLFTAEITDYNGSCFYDKNRKQMTMSVRVGVDAERGPALVDNKAELSYFLALPTFFPQAEAKRVEPVTLEFDPKRDHLHATDQEIRISFPVQNTKELERYELFIGFQLSPAELDFNRSQSSR